MSRLSVQPVPEHELHCKHDELHALHQKRRGHAGKHGAEHPRWDQQEMADYSSDSHHGGKHDERTDFTKLDGTGGKYHPLVEQAA